MGYTKKKKKKTGGRLDLAHELTLPISVLNQRDRWWYSPEAADGRFWSMRFQTAHITHKRCSTWTAASPRRPTDNASLLKTVLNSIFAPFLIWGNRNWNRNMGGEERRESKCRHQERNGSLLSPPQVSGPECGSGAGQITEYEFKLDEVRFYNT